MIVFYFLTKSAGGVESLIINLTTELVRSGVQVKVIVYRDSVIYEQLMKRKVNFEFVDLSKIDKSSFWRHVNPEDVLIFFEAQHLEELDHIERPNPKIFFWNVLRGTMNDTNTLRTLKFMSPDFLTKWQIDDLIKKNALVFMDDTCVRSIEEKFNTHAQKPVYLPVPIFAGDKNHYTDREPDEKKVFCVSYVGRPEIWKYFPALKILKDLKKISKETGRPVEFHIISNDTGFYRERIEREAGAESAGPVKVIYHDDLVLESLSKFLAERSDLHISMGTACLEGSSLGIPSILIDPSYSEIPDTYLYKWIFDTKNYCLGTFLTDKMICTEGQPLGGIMDRLRSDRRYAAEISGKCISYTKKSHSLAEIAPLFLNYANNTRARASDFKRYCLKQSPFFLFFMKMKTVFTSKKKTSL